MIYYNLVSYAIKKEEELKKREKKKNMRIICNSNN